MSFSDFYISHRTRKGNFLNQIDHLIDWKPIEQAIRRHYTPASDVIGRPAYPGLLLFKMLLVGLWHGGLSDEAVEDMANVNLHVLCFLGLALEDDVPDHSVGVVAVPDTADKSTGVGRITGRNQPANGGA